MISPGDPSLARAPSGPVSRVLREMLADRRVAIASVMLVGAVFVAIFAPIIAPYPYDKLGVGPLLTPPTPAHPMGTDQFGRDQLSRVIWGARISVAIPVAVLAGTFTLGLPLGLLIGFASGRVDNLLSRFLDLWFAFPGILFALVLATVAGPGLQTAVIAVIMIYVPIVARLVRGAVKGEVGREYVLSARVAGASPARIVLVHILPNITSPLLIFATSIAGYSILAEAGISFLGIGAQPPLSSFGKMLTDSTPYYSTASYLAIFPGLAIAYMLVALNVLGDSLRDRFDPRVS